MRVHLLLLMPRIRFIRNQKTWRRSGAQDVTELTSRTFHGQNSSTSSFPGAPNQERKITGYDSVPTADMIRKTAQQGLTIQWKSKGGAVRAEKGSPLVSCLTPRRGLQGSFEAILAGFTCISSEQHKKIGMESEHSFPYLALDG